MSSCSDTPVPSDPETPMNFVGVDLHKKLIMICVMDEHRSVKARKTFACGEPRKIAESFAALRPFRVVIEATSSYPWLVEILEPLAEKVVLANPSKLRVIAESTKKTDRLDAQVLAEFLARDMIPESYRPTPRQRQHRALVRHRQYLRGRASSVKCKIRHVLADYNADRRDLFSAQCGRAYIKGVGLNAIDRFRVADLWREWESIERRLKRTAARIKAFAAAAPKKEAEARALLVTAPGIGPVTVEVILGELGDVGRFKCAKAVCSYAGLAPVVRQSGGKKAKDGRITKEGPGLLRWALVESSWRLIASSAKWSSIYERIKKRSGSKRAVVAVARKLLCVLYAMLRDGTPYKLAA